MKIWEGIQGSPDWFEMHRGLASASNFDRVMTVKAMKRSAQSDDYIAELIAQRLFPELSMVPYGYMSPAMINGVQLEPEARRWYEYERGIEVKQVGCCFSDCGRFCASPDALIGDDGAVELKCPLPKTHIRYLLDNELPSEYKTQCHGQLIVTGRQWVDFVSYCQGAPRQFMVRVTPNDFTDALRECLNTFWLDFEYALEKVKGKAA